MVAEPGRVYMPALIGGMRGGRKLRSNTSSPSRASSVGRPPVTAEAPGKRPAMVPISTPVRGKGMSRGGKPYEDQQEAGGGKNTARVLTYGYSPMGIAGRPVESTRWRQR